MDNKEPARAWYVPYHCRCNALNGAHARCEGLAEYNGYYKLLNGDWEAETGERVSVPGQVPSGFFRRSFTLPAHWTGREIYLIFDGVSAGYTVQLNGRTVGQSGASFLPAEFRITSFLQPGANELTVLSDGSGARAGIFRDVYLLARTRTHLRDFRVRTTENTIEVETECSDLSADALLSAELYDADRQKLGNAEAHILAGRATVRFSVARPIVWNAEHPYLYTVLLMAFGEVIPVNVGLAPAGFRADGALRLNAADWDEPAASLAEIEQKLMLLKRQNVNCIRLARPDAPRFYRLCDYYGFYVMQEINERDRNHPCTLLGACKDTPAADPDFSPVAVTEIDASAGTFRLTNRYDFTDLEELEIYWRVFKQSGTEEDGVLCVSCPPRDSVSVRVPYHLPELSYEEFFIEFSFRSRKVLPWAPAGTEFGFAQLPLPVEQTTPEIMPSDKMPPLAAEVDGTEIRITGEDFLYRFDLQSGHFSALTFNGAEMLDGAPRFSDSGVSVKETLSSCRILNIAKTHLEIAASYRITTSDGTLLAEYAVFRAVFGNGEISVSISGGSRKMPEALPQFGLEFVLPDSCSRVRCFGVRGERTDVYRSSLAEEQNGFRSGTRFLCVHDQRGRGLFFKGLPDFIWSAPQAGTVRIELPDNPCCCAFTVRPVFTESLDLLRDARVIPQICD